MAKPICLIKINSTVSDNFNFFDLQKNLAEKMSDYHVFAIPFYNDEDSRAMKMEVFYEKDFTEIQYEELKKIILENIDMAKCSP